MRSKLILNPQAGPWDVRRELPAVLKHLEDHGWQTTIHQTERAGEATELAIKAREEDLDAVFVVGNAARFSETPLSATRAKEVWNAVARWIPRWPADVGFSEFLTEDELKSRTIAPFMVILHDLSDATWEAVGEKLRMWVADGTHVLVSGVPRWTSDRASSLGYLPALAEAPADETKPAWLVDRRPHVDVA